MAVVKDDALPFEKPLHELKNRIEELLASSEDSATLQVLLKPMEEQYKQVEKELYGNLSAWNTVQIARHPKRPQARDYIEKAFDDFDELHGDRAFRDDLAIVTGLATIGRHRVMLVGEHKGRNVDERHVCFAGCPHPEGYRKALRKMQMAEKFGLPIVTLVDTKGAYPGIGSEERGVAIAIAENLREMAFLRVPIICVIIGEGGSGGALGVCMGDRTLMLRHSYYSVISPEGCASILWRDGEKKAQASEALKLTCRDLKAFGLIDEIVEEPMGGAHRDPLLAAKCVREAVIANLDALENEPIDQLVEKRYEKYLGMGQFEEHLTLADVTSRWAPSPEELEAQNAEAAEETENAAAAEEAPEVAEDATSQNDDTEPTKDNEE